MKQQYRVMVLCPLIDEDTIDGTVFTQFDDQVLSEVFSTNTQVSLEEIVQSAVGAAKAASVLDCTFAVINPPEAYRTHLEQALCDVGIVPVYPVVGVSGNGMVLHLGYRNSDRLPDPAQAVGLSDRYHRWMTTHYQTIVEDDLKYCPDPWRVFVRFATKGVFKNRANERLH